MQQQAALMAASHGGYLAPSIAFPAGQIHHMGGLTLNGLPAVPMTPVSGEFHGMLGERWLLLNSYLELPAARRRATSEDEEFERSESEQTEHSQACELRLRAPNPLITA
ncbi:UNVERIFIED_CONTAM: hypothetical protein FKN15_001911 [Acipenser sinensis]